MRNSNLGIQASFTSLSPFFSVILQWLALSLHLNTQDYSTCLPLSPTSHLTPVLISCFLSESLSRNPFSRSAHVRFCRAPAISLSPPFHVYWFFPTLQSLAPPLTLSSSSVYFCPPASILIFLRLPPSPKFPVRSHFSHSLCKPLSVEPISSLPSTSPVFGFAPLSTS